MFIYLSSILEAFIHVQSPLFITLFQASECCVSDRQQRAGVNALSKCVFLYLLRIFEFTTPELQDSAVYSNFYHRPM